MRRCSVLVLATVFSCQAATLEEGDAHFRIANYREALAIYDEAPTELKDLQRIERTRYFLLEQGVRELLHLNRPVDAVSVIDAIGPMAPGDRKGELQGLRDRARLQIGNNHYLLAYDYSEGNEPAAAARELRLALSYDPEHEEAQELLASTEEWLLTQERIGQDFYFDGMDHLRAHHDLRARTSFMHAASLLGDESLAQTRLEDITVSLAEESRVLGRMFLDAGLTGPAWATILDSLHLDPTHPDALILVSEIENRISSESLLMSADIATRGGATAAADGLLQGARKLGVADHARRLIDLAEKNQDEKNRTRYARARAYELDTQMVHSLELYRAILADEGGFGWEDVELRIDSLEQRLRQAEAAYGRAIAAEQAGDDAAYAAALVETVHLAVDYEDAHARFLALP